MAPAFDDRMHRLSIERRLEREIAQARARKLLAAQAFQDVLNAVPSGIPVPDSNLRIRQARAEYDRALEACRIAVGRFADFAAKGIVPADIGREGQ